MIKVHIFTDKRNDSKKMMIHTYKKGVYQVSSNKMPYCEYTIRLYMRGHKVVEIVNVASSSDLNIKEIVI